MNEIKVFVDGGVKNNKAYASVFAQTKDFTYYSLLGGVGHITTTQAETLAMYNGMCLAEKLLYIDPYSSITIYTDLEFLYEVLNGRHIKSKYFKTYKGLRNLIEHPVYGFLGNGLEICKVKSESNYAHSVIKSSGTEIDEESIKFNNKEMCDKWNRIGTSEGLLEASINLLAAKNDCCNNCMEIALC